MMSASVSQLIFDQAEETPRAEPLAVLIWVAHVPDGSDGAEYGVEALLEMSIGLYARTRA